MVLKMLVNNVGKEVSFACEVTLGKKLALSFYEVP